MALLDAIKKNLIKVPLVSTDKDGVIEEREMLGSTALENGIAIPHAKIEGLDKVSVVIGISRLPVAFGAPDGKGTNVFFLVLAPPENPSEHIQILSSIAKACSSQLFMRMLLSSKTKEDVYNLFFE